MKLIRKVPIYAFMFSVFPVLSVYSGNFLILTFSMIFRSIVASFAYGAIILVVAKIVLKDWQKAGLVTTLGLALLFSFFPVYSLLSEFSPQLLGPLLFVVFVSTFIITSQYLVNKMGNNKEITLVVTVACIVLLLIPLSQLVNYWFSTSQANKEANKVTVGYIDEQSQMPDIYFIVLDAYTNAATLNELSGFDNEPFLQELSNLGFYIAPCSQSNYSTTYHSLRSSFFMSYLDDHLSRGATFPSLENSTLQQYLKIFGYKVVTFENRSEGNFSPNPDIRLTRNYSLPRGLNDFEIQVIGAFYFGMPLFGFSAITSQIPILRDPKISLINEHYIQTMFILDSILKSQSNEGPKFVFAHIGVPHDPYIFSPDGRFTNELIVDNQTGYRRNVEFLNNRLLPILSSIIEQSENPPIILIQGDHGPTHSNTPEQRMAILNAYYMDEEAKNQLYPSISPVNSFRLIANHYFGTDYPLLNDISYYLGENFLQESDFLDATVIDNSCGN